MNNDYLSAVPRGQLFDALKKLGVTPRYDAPQEELVNLIKQKIQGTDIQRDKELLGETFDHHLDSIVNKLFIALFVALSAIVLIIAFNYLKPSKKLFCDSENPTGLCIKCPSNAICSEGKAKCHEGFKLMHRRCIYDDDDSIYISSLYEYEIKLLEKQAGRFDCRLDKTKYITRNDLLIHLIRHSKFKNVDIEYLSNKAVDHLVYENTIGNVTEDNQELYYSTNMQKPISCIVRQEIESHIFLTISISIILLSTAIYIYVQSVKNNRRKQSFLFVQSMINSYRNHHIPVNEDTIRSNLVSIDPNPDSLMPYVLDELRRNPKVKTSYICGSLTFRFDQK